MEVEFAVGEGAAGFEVLVVEDFDLATGAMETDQPPAGENGPESKIGEDILEVEGVYNILHRNILSSSSN